MLWMLVSWFVSVSLSGNVLSGNSNLRVISGTLETGYHTGPAKLSWQVKGLYSLQDTVETARSLESSLQLDHPLSPRIEFFLLTHGYTDPVARTDYLVDGGMGLKYRFLETPQREISVSLAPLFSVRKFLGEPGEQNWILSLRPKLEWPTPGGGVLRWLLFYQPNLQDREDVRILSTVRAEAPLSRTFRLLIEVEDRYLSRVPAAVKHNDLRITVGLKGTWKRPASP